jgi:hypothetical protein
MTTDRLTEAQGALMTLRLFAWLDLLDAVSPEGYSYEIDAPRKGQRYARVVMRINGAHASVHAFYDLRTGDVYKAAGWKAPAKHVRYRLLDDDSFGAMVKAIASNQDWSGGYLYMR